MIRLAAIGAGDRTRKYLDYVQSIPRRARLVAVAEPMAARRQAVAAQFGLPADACFAGWEQLVAAPGVQADAAIIATPDHLHYAPAMACLQRGLHILLEKPIAQSYTQCRQIAHAAAAARRVAGVCYVMRYYPCYVAARQLIGQGSVGRIMTVTHREAVGMERMLHSFVRGIWRNEQTSNPILLSKMSHDIDMLVHLTGLTMERLSSLGGLRWFAPHNAPPQATERCIDCPLDGSCLYSAVEIYQRRRHCLQHFDDTTPQGIQHQLRHSPYGRCAFRCDNTVADGQSLIMSMTGGALFNVMLDVFSQDDGRTTHIMGTQGELRFTESHLALTRFADGSTHEQDFARAAAAYHFGADRAVVDDFLSAIESGHPCACGIESALESHRIAFEAERLRRAGDPCAPVVNKI